MGFSFPIQIFGWNVIKLRFLLHTGLRQVWVPQLPGCGGGKCSEVINPELRGQGCSALPEQALRARLELSQQAAQGGG